MKSTLRPIEHSRVVVWTNPTGIGYPLCVVSYRGVEVARRQFKHMPHHDEVEEWAQRMLRRKRRWARALYRRTPPKQGVER